MVKKQKWVFIVNPTAGGGHGRRILPDLEQNLADQSIDAKIVFTEKNGHAAELSRKYLEKGYSHIIGVGGDGTMNEVSKPLLKNPEIITGLIPAGTGNDFIQILGFPDRFSKEHWKIFFNQQTIAMDVGMVNGKHFLNGMGLGFDAQVAAENYVAPGEVAGGKGKGKYLWHILKTLLFYRECRVSIMSGGNAQETDCFMNTIAIGRRFAGNFLITPEAVANDGLLDVTMIRKLNLFQRLKILTMVPKGSHLRDPRVEYYQTGGLQVIFNSKVPFHVDGELYFDTTFEVSIVPASLQIIYNPEGAHFFR